VVRIKHRLGVGLILIQLAACSASPPPPVGAQEALRDKPVSQPTLSVAPVLEPTSPQPQFVPVASDKPLQEGRPTWYKRSKFTHTTATGEALDDRLFTAAHLTLPLGSYLRVIDTATGNSVIVRVADALGVFRNPKMIVRLEPLSGVPATPVPVSTLPTGAAALAALGGGKPKVTAAKPGAQKPASSKPATAKPTAAKAKPAPAKSPAKKPDAKKPTPAKP